MIIIINRMKEEVRTLEPADITIYLDMFFLVNFLMDLLLLDLMKHFLKLPGKRRRLLAASLIGAAGSCAVLIVQIWLLSGRISYGDSGGSLYVAEAGWRGWLQTAVFWGLELAAGIVGMPAFMLLAAFGRKPARAFIRSLVVFDGLGALAGGILSLAEGPGTSGWYLSGTAMARQWKLLPFLLWAGGMYFALRALEQRVRQWRQERELYCQVKLFYRGRSQVVTALWDTGNHLYEPYGHQPVHVITEEACRRLCDTVNRVVFIPFQAVGTGHGLLPGIRIDGMEVFKNGQPFRHYDRPWLAISKGPLSFGQRYEMLLHGEERE